MYTLLKKTIKHVFIISMDVTTMDNALKAIGEDMGEEAAKKVTWLQCDLSEWSKVTKIADQIASSTDRVNILIGDAGRGIIIYQLTSYGVDRCLAVNV